MSAAFHWPPLPPKSPILRRGDVPRRPPPRVRAEARSASPSEGLAPLGRDGAGHSCRRGEAAGEAGGGESPGLGGEEPQRAGKAEGAINHRLRGLRAGDAETVEHANNLPRTVPARAQPEAVGGRQRGAQGPPGAYRAPGLRPLWPSLCAGYPVPADMLRSLPGGQKSGADRREYGDQEAPGDARTAAVPVVPGALHAEARQRRGVLPPVRPAAGLLPGAGAASRTLRMSAPARRHDPAAVRQHEPAKRGEGIRYSRLGSGRRHRTLRDALREGGGRPVTTPKTAKAPEGAL